eukprot:gene11585-11681_t
MYGEGDEIRDGAVEVLDGPFAGWMTWPDTDPYESLSGPYFFKADANGKIVCAMRAEAKHMNGQGSIHGGALMTFADFSLFALSRKERGSGPSVTISMNSEFVGPAVIGDLIICKGEVIRAGGSLVFIRGMISVEDRPVLNFSGVIKKIKVRT